MHVISVISTKGGVGKTTITANLGALMADAKLRVLLLDLDVQPTLSSYYPLRHRASAGTYELLASNERHLAQLVSHTSVACLDIILSNDDHRQLNTLLMHAPDGRLRLRNLLPVFQPHYDLVLIDTQGARSVLVEMAVLASRQVISPITPEILAARELRRGTLQLIEDIAPYRHLGIALPEVHLLINRMPVISTNAKLIRQSLRQLFQDQPGIHVLHTEVPANEAFPAAAVKGLPAHRVETRRPGGRLSPAALTVMQTLATELCPHWREAIARVTGKTARRHSHAGSS